MSLKIVIMSGLLLAAPVVCAQSHSAGISEIDEPPELTGTPRQVPSLSDHLRQFRLIMDKWNEHDIEQIRDLQPQLETFIGSYPQYSDAYALRAIGRLCYLKSRDFGPILTDVVKAIATAPQQEGQLTFDLNELYGVRAKVLFEMGRPLEAIDDLEFAVRLSPSSSGRIFMSQDKEPATSHSFLWSKSDLDRLVLQFPKDYRAFLIRGVYVASFSFYDEQYSNSARRDFQQSIALNPRSPLPYYYLGDLFLHMRANDARSNNEVLSDAIKALEQFTKALDCDGKFVAAYEQRASALGVLKERGGNTVLNLAVKDYDKILELDPDNIVARQSRALANLELNHYQSAIADFDRAINRTSKHNWLFNTYFDFTNFRNRARAYLAVGEYSKAIDDLTTLIKNELASAGASLDIHLFRAFYPEYEKVPTETICKKLASLLFPQQDYGSYAKEFSTKHSSDDAGLLLFATLFEKRGDAYMRAHEFRRGASDFRRIERASPQFSVDRWRLVGSTVGGDEYSLDVKTARFPTDGPVRLWIKTERKDRSHTVESLDVDCRSGQIRLTSITAYKADGVVVSSSDTSGSWRRPVPDTRGEELYKGSCEGRLASLH